MKYYTYQLIDSLTNKVFYIGKGSGKRCYKHIVIAKNNNVNKKKNPKLYNKIDKIISLNGEVIVEKIYHSDNEILVLEYEKEIIAKIGLTNLCNLTIGGEGTSYKNGFTLEHKINILIGRYTNKLGRNLTEYEINDIKNNILKKPLKDKIRKILKSVSKKKKKTCLKVKIRKILKSVSKKPIKKTCLKVKIRKILKSVSKKKKKTYLKVKIRKILKLVSKKKKKTYLKVKIRKILKLVSKKPIKPKIYKKGEALPQEVKDNMSKSHKGKKFTNEHKIQISKSLSGRILSEEHKKNLSISNKKPKVNLSYSFLSYIDAKNWIKEKLRINTKNEWMNYTKENNYPIFLPKSPYSYYEKRGWISWSDFLCK